MPRYNNYSLVIGGSNFNPYQSLQEMLVPFTAYKDAYEKQEAALEDISNRDIFKVLADLPEGSKSRAIYEGYMNDFNSQSDDFAKNGLTMQNRRALNTLKKRYGQEIGRLEAANTALQEERKLRRANKDTSMLYANDNLNIDDFLDGNTPNLYNISGTELYTRGAAAGKAASSRIYSAGDEGSTLGGYYRKWVERNGYSKESMDAFRANASAIPELQQAANAILAERGALENLTGNNLERARQSVINGIIDGAVYTEKVNPVRDAGVMSAAERAADSRDREGQALTAAVHGMERDGKGGYRWNPDKDPSFQKAAKAAELKAKQSAASGKGSAGYDDRNKQAIAVGSSGSIKIADSDGKLLGMNISDLPAQVVSWTDIINKDGSIKDKNLAAALKNSSIYGYEVYRIPKGTELDGSGWVWDDSTDEDYYILLPRDSKKAGDGGSDVQISADGSNDIPELP